MTKARTTTPTTVPGIPAIPSSVTSELRRYLESLSEALEIRLGRRGDDRDRAITLRELIDSGLAVELANRPFNPNGGGGTTFRPPYDGTVPPAPTGFEANGGYAIVTLFWDYPKFLMYSHTEIWRHSENILGDAQLIGTSSGTTYIDPVGEGSTYYYWIRHVSTSDVYGPFNSPDGTLAQTALDVDVLLNALYGAITSSQLAQALGSRIDLIDADAAVINSVAYRVTQEATARSTAISNEAAARAAAINIAVDTLQSQINDLSAIAEYDNAKAYVTGELVTYNGFLYKAKSATTGNLPTNTTYWELLGEYSSLADIVNQNAASIVQINTINATSTSAAAQAIQAVTATVNNPTTGLAATASSLSAVTSQVNNSTTGLSATVARVGALETTVNDPSTGVSATSAALDLVETTVNNGTTGVVATANRVSSLETTVNHPTTGLPATRATLINDYYTKAATDGAIATSSNLLTAQINVRNRTFRQNDAPPSAGLAVGDLWFDSNDNNKAYRWDGAAWVATDDTRIAGTIADLAQNYYTIAEADEAIAGASLTLQTQINNKNRTFRQASAPGALGLSIGDLWFDSDDNNKAYRWDGSAWVASDDARIASTAANLQNNYYTISAADEAIAAATLNLVSNTALTTTLNSYVTNSTLTQNYYTRTLTDEAISNATLNLVSTTTLNNYVTNSTLTQQYYTRSLTDQAISNATTTLSASIASTYPTTVAVQQNYFAKASGQALEGRYTVKIDNNGHVSGFGLASESNNGATSSAFIIRADKFAIVSPTSTDNNLTNTPAEVTMPFSVVTTTQVIDGVTVPPGVYIKDAFIRNGTIKKAMIGLGEIDTANIGVLDASVIQTGQFSADFILIDDTVLDTVPDPVLGKRRLYIPNGRIDNAQIKDLAVDTLKIAGNSITIPLSFTGGDIYVDTAISITSGGTSCNYVYVGTNQGEYVVGYIDPWTSEIYYSYVGFPNGDFNYVCTTTTPTFSGAKTAIETSLITVGDITDGGSIVVFYATMDAGTTQDAGQHLYMLVDKYDGNGYQIVAQTVAGTRTASGDTYASIPMALSTTITNVAQMKVKVVTGTRRVDLYPGTGSSPSTLRNVSLSIMGARR